MSTLFLAIIASACDPRDDARVTVRYRESPRLPRDLLTVTARDGAMARTLTSGSLGSSTETATPVDTRTDGTLRVHFRFAEGQVVVSEGEVAVTLRGDWEYGFDLSVDSLNPSRTCFGCQGAKSFPLLPAYQRNARDSVWVVWSGNSIRHPVTY